MISHNPTLLRRTALRYNRVAFHIWKLENDAQYAATDAKKSKPMTPMQLVMMSKPTFSRRYPEYSDDIDYTKLHKN